MPANDFSELFKEVSSPAKVDLTPTSSRSQPDIGWYSCRFRLDRFLYACVHVTFKNQKVRMILHKAFTTTSTLTKCSCFLFTQTQKRSFADNEWTTRIAIVWRWKMYYCVLEPLNETQLRFSFYCFNGTDANFTKLTNFCIAKKLLFYSERYAHYWNSPTFWSLALLQL